MRVFFGRLAVLSLSALSLIGCATDQRGEAVSSAGASVEHEAQETEPHAEAAPATPREAVEPQAWTELKAEIRTEFPTVKQLSARELEDWLATGEKAPLLLDVRAPEEFEVSHLRTALLAPGESDALRLLAEVPVDRRVVLYCSVGYRSSALAEKLARRGYTNVFNLEGSIFEWANAGGALYSGETETRVVHPYDAHWGRLLRRELWSPLGGSGAGQERR